MRLAVGSQFHLTRSLALRFRRLVIHYRLMATQTCKKCGETLPLNRDHFGNTNNGGVIGWRGTCRAFMRANSAKHAAQNPGQYQQRQQLRAQRERSAGSTIAGVNVQALRKVLGDRCRYCDVALDGAGELDHLTPVARGGSGRPQNVTLSCMPCNRSKLAKTLNEFLAWRRERGLAFRDVAITGEAPDPPSTDTQRRRF